MPRRWLLYLTFGVIAGIVLVFFGLSLQPVVIPSAPAEDVPVVTAPTATFVDPTLGPANASVTIFEFSDFQCGPCSDADAAARAVQAAYPKDVRLVWKYMPNDSLHPLATPAAVAAQCAQAQGKFWPFAQELFTEALTLTSDQFTQIAQDSGLDATKFQSCDAAQDAPAVVQEDYEEGLGLKITATPTLFINDQRVVGAVTQDQLTTYVTQALAAKK